MRPVALCFIAVCASAQTSSPTNPLLTTNDANQMATRITQLMESTAAVVPGLVKTSAVVAESAHQALTAMQVTPGNSSLTFDFLSQAHAYLSLTDAMPKPYPMPE